MAGYSFKLLCKRLTAEIGSRIKNCTSIEWYTYLHSMDICLAIQCHKTWFIFTVPYFVINDPYKLDKTYFIELIKDFQIYYGGYNL